MFCALDFEYKFKFSLQFIINLSLNSSCRTEGELVNKIVEDMYNKVKPIENNKGDLEATKEAKNKEHVASSISNFNLGNQGNVVSNVGRDYIGGNVTKG